TCECRNQSAAHRRDSRLAILRRERRIAKEGDLAQIELLQSRLVSSLSVGIGQGREVLAVIWRIFEELREQLARLLELSGLSRFSCRFKRELRAQCGISLLGSFEQYHDGLWILLPAPVEIHRRAHYAEDF